jgi:hypothetical protein
MWMDKRQTWGFCASSPCRPNSARTVFQTQQPCSIEGIEENSRNNPVLDGGDLVSHNAEELLFIYLFPVKGARLPKILFTIPWRGTILCDESQPFVESDQKQQLPNMEDAMKVPVTLLSLVFAGLIFAAWPAGATQEAAEKKDAPAAKKETKWQGHVVRLSKDQSTMEIRGGSAPSQDLRKVAYDSSTQWTNQGRPGQQDEVKEGSFVILLGHVDDSGVLHATRIDLRLPR